MYDFTIIFILFLFCKELQNLGEFKSWTDWRIEFNVPLMIQNKV